jgi:hypothetical protein
MNEANKKKADLKQKFVRELINYWITFLYLAFFFGAFAWYRRLILAEYGISYLHYGTALVEALILAKVILIGDALHLGRKLEEKPLIIPTLYKTVVFCVFVGIFGVLEHTIEGLIHGKGLAAGFKEVLSEGQYQLLARCLVTFFAFIPFFAFKELGRVLGEGKIHKLFFRKRAATESEISAGSKPKQKDDTGGQAGDFAH